MAFSAVITGMVVSLAVFAVMSVSFSAGVLPSLGIATLAGQAMFALVLAKAVLCRSMRKKAATRAVDLLRA